MIKALWAAPNWQISRLSMGTYAFGGRWGQQEEQQSVAALSAAVEQGVNLIDTALAYGDGLAERIVGKFAKSSVKPIHICTKIPPFERRWAPADGSNFLEVYPPEHMERSLVASLRNLGLEHVDIVLLHTWAEGFQSYDEWKEMFISWKKRGMVSLTGISTLDLTPEVVCPAMETGCLDVVQVLFNIFDQQPIQRLFPIAERLGIAIMARSPLDEGSLTGKFQSGATFTPDDFRSRFFNSENLQDTIARVARIKKHVEDHHAGMSLLEFALNYCLSFSAVSTVLVGARSAVQARLNFLDRIRRPLAPEELQSLEAFAWPRKTRAGVTN